MLKQLLAVSMLALSSVPARKGESLVVVIGMATVVCIVLAMLATAEGLGRSFSTAARSDRVVVIKSAQLGKKNSGLSRQQADALFATAGFAQSDGTVLLSVEKIHAVVYRELNNREVTLALHGVGASASRVWPEVQLLNGRWFSPGLREVMVGRALAERVPELRVGATVKLGQASWTIVGEFAAGGATIESELWGDVDVITATYTPGEAYNAATALLAAGETVASVKERMTQNASLSHTLIAEPEYFASQAAIPMTVLRIVAIVVGVIMTLGVVFAAVNTMYASVQSRTREIATLRALGFASGAVVTSVLVEAIALCVAGGATGCLVAFGLFDGRVLSTLSSQTGSITSFSMALSPTLMLRSIIWGTVVGGLSGLLPALKTARMPIVIGLRAS